MLGQRSRHGDDDGVDLAQLVEIGGRAETFFLDRGGNRLERDMLDEVFAAIELSDALGVDVETDHREARLARGKSQRNADIAKSDDADLEATIAHALHERAYGLIVDLTHEACFGDDQICSKDVAQSHSVKRRPVKLYR